MRKTFLGKTTDKHEAEKSEDIKKEATTNTLSINKNIKGEFSISFFSITHSSHVAKENILKKDKNGRFPRCIFLFTSHMIFPPHVLTRASCLYDMIPFLFLTDRIQYFLNTYTLLLCLQASSE